MKHIAKCALYFAATISLSNAGSLENKEGETDLPDLTFFVVNLDRAVARREYIENQFKNVNLHFTRISAVDGKTLNIDSLVRSGILQMWPERLDRVLTPGEIGNYLSHRKAWQEIANRKREIAVVFEDDVIIESDFPNKLRKAISALPKDWDALYLGCHAESDWGCTPKRLKTVLGGQFIVMDDTGTAGNYAYVLNWKGAAKLFKNSLPIVEPTDGFIRYHMLSDEIGNFKSYCVNPEIIKVNYNIESDIKKMGRP